MKIFRTKSTTMKQSPSLPKQLQDVKIKAALKVALLWNHWHWLFDIQKINEKTNEQGLELTKNDIKGWDDVISGLKTNPGV